VSKTLFPHLAELIQEEMDERGWTITDLVTNMGPFWNEKDWGICQISWELFLTVRDPDMILGDDMADQIAEAFGVSRQFFTNYHEAWRRECKRAAVEEGVEVKP
jgi:plasmid maintenance system antidote protein VapI